MKTALLIPLLLVSCLYMTGCQLLQRNVQALGPAAQGNGLDAGQFSPGGNLTNSGNGSFADILARVQQATGREATPSLQQGAGLYDPDGNQGLLPAGSNSSGSSSVQALASRSDIRALGQKVDAYINKFPGSKLRGQGAFIAACSAKYRVPVDLALAMWIKEAQMCAKGIAPKTNNPGNIKDTRGKYGQIVGTYKGFGVYDSIPTGIEAYFRLMSNPSGPYWQHVQSGNIAAIIKKYAPSSDGNNERNYVASVNADRQKIRSALA